MIHSYERYHGIVFNRIVNGSREPVSIVSHGNPQGHSAYIINGEVGIFIKFSTRRMSPWRFTFLQTHQDEMARIRSQYNNVYLVLVCGEDGIVTLDYKTLKIVLDDQHMSSEWIAVARRRNEKYSVWGSNGELNFKIADSDFPKTILNQKR